MFKTKFVTIVLAIHILHDKVEGTKIAECKLHGKNGLEGNNSYDLDRIYFVFIKLIF